MNRSLPLAALVALAACNSDGPSGPSGPVEQVVVDMCSNLGLFGFSWVGVQNEGTGWQQITPSNDGTLTFDATERLSLAVVIDLFGTSITQVLNVSRDEIQSDAGVNLCDQFGDRTIRGTATGLTGESFGDIYSGFSGDFVYPDDPDFEVSGLPNSGMVDLIALRFPSSLSNSAPDRVIVRRNLTPTSAGQEVPTLAFDSEGAPPQVNTLTVANAGSAFSTAEFAVSTANNTYAYFGTQFSTGSNTFSYPGLPAALRLPTDVHELLVIAQAEVSEREVIHYFGAPEDLTVTLGANLSAPAITQVATSPYRRLRATLPSQPDYPAAAIADFVQGLGGESGGRIVSILTTSGYTGGSTPATWTLEIPDFGSSGYQAAWGLNSGGYEWSVSATSGSATESAPLAGNTVRTATVYSEFVESRVPSAQSRRGRMDGGRNARASHPLLKAAARRRR